MSCRHFGACGGCAYLDIPYEEELLLKERALRDELGPLLEGVLPSPSPVRYRNKMELAFGDEGIGGRLALGIRKKRSMYEVAPIDECALVPPEFALIAGVAADYFREAGERFYHKRRRDGALRHLTVRKGEFTGEALAMLSATSGLSAPLEPLARALAGKLPGLVGFLSAANDGVADVVRAEGARTIYGRNFYRERLLGLDFEVSIDSFFQTNSGAAETLYRTVLEFAGGPGDLALDLYCGAGTITRAIAPLFARAVGIELSEAAVESARRAAPANCEFHAGDVVKIMQENRFAEPCLLVADPPRDGLPPKVLPHIARLSPKKLVYVACKPKSLARDIPLLGEIGYGLARLKAVDMFPRTPHVEVVALFEAAP